MSSETPTKRKAKNCPDPQVSSAKRKSTRHRASLACEECRSRKRRCDGATPACGGCVKRMSACVYTAEIHAKAWRETMIHSLRNRLEELEKEEGLEPTVEAPRAANEPLYQGSGHSQHPTMTGTGVQHNQSISDEVQSRPTSRPTSPAADLTVTAHQPAPTAERSSVNTFAISESIPKSYNSKSLEPCSVERLMRPIDHAIDLWKGPKLAASNTTARPGNQDPGREPPAAVIKCSCDHLLSSTRWRLPLRRHADGLVTLYFTRVQRMYPILHERTFRRQYECLWQSVSGSSAGSADCSGLCKQKNQGTIFPATVYTVFAMASLFESDTLERTTRQAEDYFCLAQEIDLLEILDYEVRIELVQLGLLMGFYLQSTERFSKCWNITGLTVRMAQNMGLQLTLNEARQKGLFSANATQVDCEMRSRVWYGCVLLDREISMSFGRPLMIATGSEAAPLPQPIDDDRLSGELGQQNTQPKDVPSLLESYIQTITLYNILSEVLDREELKDTSNPRPDVRSLLTLDTKIMEWRDALPSYLQYNPSLEETGFVPRQTLDQCIPPQADIFAQAKRLYTRFLHVRVLILRPALDLLFQQQQQQLHSPRVTRKTVLDKPVQDLLLSSIVTQCSLSAHSLVNFLQSQIQSGDLVAWWYNISYLHTCGSTLLMSRLCSFGDLKMSSDFASSWTLCLQCISRYTTVSSIAKKSFSLLKSSGKCLLPDDTLVELLPPPPRILDTRAPQTSVGTGAEGLPGQTWHIPRSRVHSPHMMESFLLEPEARPEPFDIASSELWINEPASSSYWPFMPFLSQLESLPPGPDSSNLPE